MFKFFKKMISNENIKKLTNQGPKTKPKRNILKIKTLNKLALNKFLFIFIFIKTNDKNLNI